MRIVKFALHQRRYWLLLALISCFLSSNAAGQDSLLCPLWIKFPQNAVPNQLSAAACSKVEFMDVQAARDTAFTSARRQIEEFINGRRSTQTEQVERVREFTASGENLIVNSYGGYLLMLSLIDAHKAPERVLMLSPLLGRSVLPKNMMASRPPREKALKLALAEGRVTKPKYLRIVTGEDDAICCTELARSVSHQLEADRLDVIPGEGHDISPKYVQAALES